MGFQGVRGPGSSSVFRHFYVVQICFQNPTYPPRGYSDDFTHTYARTTFWSKIFELVCLSSINSLIQGNITITQLITIWSMKYNFDESTLWFCSPFYCHHVTQSPHRSKFRRLLGVWNTMQSSKMLKKVLSVKASKGRFCKKKNTFSEALRYYEVTLIPKCWRRQDL